VLAIFLGAFGAHKFYLGRPLAGLCHLLLGLVWFGALLGVIEGLIYLLRSDEDFIARYQLGSQAWL
jgi:TM2 domain-containing membrane protein YozV